jgi:protein O-mannosyl-transferase
LEVGPKQSGLMARSSSVPRPVPRAPEVHAAGGAWLEFGRAVALVVATLLVYAPAWRAAFIWNDADYVTAPALRSTAGLGRIWFELGATEQYYPLLHSAFWLEHRCWGDSPLGYHLLNIALHALSACLLAAVLRRLRVPGAWLAAAIFALHPVYVESVAWISEQKNTLSLVFYLLAALNYLNFDAERRRAAYGWATFFFGCALLSKTTTATLPAALLVVCWWQRGRIEVRRDVLPLLPWFALGAGMGLVSAWVEKRYIGAEGAEFALHLGERALLAGRIAWFYLAKLIWPAELIFIYPRWQIDAAAAWQWSFSLGALAFLAVLWRRRFRSRAPLAAALFFGGSLFPVLGFFNVYAFLFSYVADHWQYLPSIGVVVLGAAALERVGARARPVFRLGVPALLLAVLALLTWRQSRMYADMDTFYEATLARNPTAWMAHNNLGSLRREQGRLPEAIAHYEAALQVRPDLVKVEQNLGTCYFDRRDFAAAETHYRRALALQPNYVDALNNLGRLLRETGRPAEAIPFLLGAVRSDPEYAEARNNLGMALRDAGRNGDALVQFERAVRLNPAMPAAQLNLALSLSLAGRDDEARTHYREARRLNPRIPPLPGW